MVWECDVVAIHQGETAPDTKYCIVHYDHRYNQH